MAKSSIAVLAVSAAAFFAALAGALAHGDFDPAFGTEGKFVHPLGEGTRPGSSVSALALQPDGKIVVTGVASESKAVIARITTNGALDQSFGAGGRLLTNLGAGANEAAFPRALVVQPDGKIVVGGVMGNFVTQANEFLVARVHVDGSAPDPSFGTGGVVRTQLGLGMNPFSSVGALAVLPDGRILAAGGARNSSNQAATLIARLNAADGSFDQSFGAAGKITPQLGLGTSPSSGVNALALHPDGRILAGGFATDDNNTQPDAIALARLSSDGMTFDATFDGDGKLVTRLGQTSPVITTLSALLLQPDGKIVVGGEAIDGQAHRMTLFGRLNADGSPDPEFGSGGTFISQLGEGGNPSSSITALALQPDGKIVAVGNATVANGGAGVLIARLRANGTLDPSFAAGGKLVTQLGPASSSLAAAAIQPDGKAVAGGAVTDATPDFHSLLARVILDLPPSASFTAAPNPIQAGQSVAFADSGSVDPEGTTVTFAWDFGDGATAAGPNVSHTYLIPGTHTAMLTVRDGYGLSATASQTITVNTPVISVPGPPPPPPPVSPPPPRRTPSPVLSRLTVRPQAFQVVSRVLTQRRRAGAVISYRDTLAATTTFVVARALPGRRSGRRCVVETTRNRTARRCTRFVRVPGSFSHRDRVGANTVPFAGRVRGRALAPGRYRLSATPRRAGKVGRTATARFRIVT